MTIQSQTTEENTVKNEETPVMTLHVNSIEFTVKPGIADTIIAFLQNTVDSPGAITGMVLSDYVTKTKPVSELLTEISETVELILDMSKNKGVEFIRINGNMFEVNSGWHARLKRLPETLAKAKSLLESSMNDLKGDKSVNAKAVQFLNSCEGLKIGFVEKQELCDAVAKQLIDFYGLPLSKLDAVIDSAIGTCLYYLSMSPNEWEGREASSEIPVLIRQKIVYIHSALCAIKSKMKEPTMNTKTGSISAELESILKTYVYYCREVKPDLSLADVKAITFRVLTHGTFSSMGGWKAVADVVEEATVEQVYEAYVNVSGSPVEGREPLLKLMKYLCGIVSVSNSMEILMSPVPASQPGTFWQNQQAGSAGFLPGGQTPGQHNSPISGFQTMNPFTPQAGVFQQVPWNYGGNSRTGQGPVNVGAPDMGMNGFSACRDRSMEALENRLTALIQDMNNLKLSRSTGYMAQQQPGM